LRAFISTRGSELLRQHVSRLDHGWRYGLPDFLKCRFAAEKAAEIDDLMLAGKQVEATRRLHELSGKTWDQTLATIQAWRNLGRERKLALFGWDPVEKHPAVGSAT